MSCWAIIPIKEPRACKQRLAPCLSSAQRQSLVQELLSHVIGVLTQTPGIDRILIVSPHVQRNFPHIQTLKRARRGLNEDLTHAVQYASAQGATTVAIVPADLPFLNASETTDLLAAVPTRGIAIAPDQRLRGTNAIAFCLPAPVLLNFGHDSFHRHVAQGQKLGGSVAIVQRTGLAFDVDNAADLDVLYVLRQSDRQTGLGTAAAVTPQPQAAV